MVTVSRFLQLPEVCLYAGMLEQGQNVYRLSCAQNALPDPTRP